MYAFNDRIINIVSYSNINKRRITMMLRRIIWFEQYCTTLYVYTW